MRSKSLSVMTLAVVSVVVAVPSLAQQPIRLGASIAISGRDAVQGGYVREGASKLRFPTPPWRQR